MTNSATIACSFSLFNIFDIINILDTIRSFYLPVLFNMFSKNLSNFQLALKQERNRV